MMQGRTGNMDVSCYVKVTGEQGCRKQETALSGHCQTHLLCPETLASDPRWQCMAANVDRFQTLWREG